MMNQNFTFNKLPELNFNICLPFEELLCVNCTVCIANGNTLQILLKMRAFPST